MKTPLFAFLTIVSLCRCRPSSAPTASPSPTPPLPLPSAPPPTPAPFSASLQSGYTQASASFAAQLRDAINRPEAQERLLAKSRKWEGEYKKVLTIFAKRHGSKFAPEPGETLVGVVLQRISQQAPSLHEDKTDLLRPFKSTVVVHLKIDKPTTAPFPEKEGMFNYDIELPATANPEGVWTFPTIDTALKEIGKRCDGPGDFYMEQEEYYLGLLKE